MTDKVQKIRQEVEKLKSNLIHGACASQIAMETRCKEEAYDEVISLLDSLQEDAVSEYLEEAAKRYSDNENPICTCGECLLKSFKAGAKWQEKQDQSTIELAEDHAYFAGRTKTVDEIKETLLSEVLPCFMHGGEADEVVAKLDEVLNQKK